MKFLSTPLTGSYQVELEPKTDDRGWFTRYYCKQEFAEIGHSDEWVQMNHSFTAIKGTLRGMHFQLAPVSEIKLVRCIRGAIFDVIVDLRRNSETFLQWFGMELSSSNQKMIYIPAGFAHGFQSLEDNCEVLYHHTAYYTPEKESGMRYDDPRAAILWPLPVTVISERDKNHSLMGFSFKGI